MTSALIAALVLANVLAFAPALSSPFWAQTPGGQGRRTPPPQPQQTQSPAYFVGTWRFSWTGRESPITPGPRSGIATFALNGNVRRKDDNEPVPTAELGLLIIRCFAERTRGIEPVEGAR